MSSEQRSFDVVRRGYDIDQVEKFLVMQAEAWSAELELARGRIAVLEDEMRRLRSIETEAEHLRRRTEMLGTEQAEAEHTRSAMLEQANHEALRIRTEAQREAAKLRHDAELARARIEAEARNRTSEHENEARAASNQLVVEAERIRAEAVSQANRLRSEARQVREDADAEVAAKLDADVGDQLKLLEERRRRLDEDYVQAKSQYERVVAAMGAKVSELRSTHQALITGLQAIAKGGLSQLPGADAELPTSVGEDVTPALTETTGPRASYYRHDEVHSHRVDDAVEQVDEHGDEAGTDSEVDGEVDDEDEVLAEPVAEAELQVDDDEADEVDHGIDEVDDGADAAEVHVEAPDIGDVFDDEPVAAAPEVDDGVDTVPDEPEPELDDLMATAQHPVIVVDDGAAGDELPARVEPPVGSAERERPVIGGHGDARHLHGAGDELRPRFASVFDRPEDVHHQDEQEDDLHDRVVAETEDGEEIGEPLAWRPRRPTAAGWPTRARVAQDDSIMLEVDGGTAKTEVDHQAERDRIGSGDGVPGPPSLFGQRPSSATPPLPPGRPSTTSATGMPARGPIHRPPSALDDWSMPAQPIDTDEDEHEDEPITLDESDGNDDEQAAQDETVVDEPDAESEGHEVLASAPPMPGEESQSFRFGQPRLGEPPMPPGPNGSPTSGFGNRSGVPSLADLPGPDDKLSGGSDEPTAEVPVARSDRWSHHNG